jgi:hypothetical protein
MHEVSSLRSKQSQFALHSPLATHLVPRSQPPIEARNRRTRYIIERWSPRAGAAVRARQRLPSDRLGCRVGVSLSSVLVSRGGSRSSGVGSFSAAGSVSLSYRAPFQRTMHITGGGATALSIGLKRNPAVQ